MNYIVIDNNDVTMTYVVSDLYSLINEMYSCEVDNGMEFADVSRLFHLAHTVFKIEGHIHQIKKIS